MRTLDNAGQIVDDHWVHLADEALAPAAGAFIVSLARLQAEPDVRTGALGVALPVGGDVEALLPWLDRLALIALPFPVFKDGRGFTNARELRERHRFAGDIRATGHILPDQYVALLRCGVSTVEVAETAELGPWRASLARYATEATPTSQRALPYLRRAALPFTAV